MARRRAAPSGRRSGPDGEHRWWDPADQARAESRLVWRRDLPRGWHEVPMVNNVERLDPWADVAVAAELRAARAARRLTALDEGAAWRDRDGRLLVVRVEAFADPDDELHRLIWARDAVACLEALWRARWAERGQVGGWVEARRHEAEPAGGPPAAGPETAQPDDPRIDWLEVEDHTDPTGGGAVTSYQHLTIWAVRRHVVLTLRHPLGDGLDRTVDRVGRLVADRAAAEGDRQR